MHETNEGIRDGLQWAPRSRAALTASPGGSLLLVAQAVLRQAHQVVDESVGEGDAVDLQARGEQHILRGVAWQAPVGHQAVLEQLPPVGALALDTATTFTPAESVPQGAPGRS